MSDEKGLSQRWYDSFRNWWIVTSLAWWLGAVVVLFLNFSLGGTLAMRCYTIAVIFFSGSAFLAYGLDKWKAKSQSSRISERTLHLLAALGGWPGAFLGRETFRHKTQKLSFRLLLPTFALLHLILALSLYSWT